MFGCYGLREEFGSCVSETKGYMDFDLIMLFTLFNIMMIAVLFMCFLCMQLKKEKDMLKESQSQSFGLIRVHLYPGYVVFSFSIM